ncbi:cytochrome c3 family protein, partial [bacterium]|nr:cytochrome c3 family protein [bacterium]
MRRSIPTQMMVAGLAVAFFLVSGFAIASAEDVAREFVGVKKCKVCHKKDEDGNQYGQWMETSHAKAFETLASEESMTIAKGKGIDNPQTANECLQCHVTAFPVMADLATQKITMEEGVSCESCHGAGGDYYKKKTMAAISAGEEDGAALGLVTPNEAVCTQCHNDKSPTFEGFDFKE